MSAHRHPGRAPADYDRKSGFASPNTLCGLVRSAAHRYIAGDGALARQRVTVPVRRGPDPMAWPAPEPE